MFYTKGIDNVNVSETIQMFISDLKNKYSDADFRVIESSQGQLVTDSRQMCDNIKSLIKVKSDNGGGNVELVNFNCCVKMQKVCEILEDSTPYERGLTIFKYVYKKMSYKDTVDTLSLAICSVDGVNFHNLYTMHMEDWQYNDYCNSQTKQGLIPNPITL